VRIVREVQAGLRVRGVPGGVDPERTDLPVGGNRSHQEENRDQPGEEEQKAGLPAPAAVPFAARGVNLIAGLLRLYGERDGIKHDAHLNQGGRAAIGFTAPRNRGWFALVGHTGLRHLGGHRRGSREWATNELGQPFLQPFFIQAGCRILRLQGTPGCKAHLRPP
jgi:hypothetical protein